MTKKIITLAIVIIMLTTFLTGCNFFQLNEEREANQVLATINYNGKTNTIKQNEMLDYFNSNAQNTMQTYGYNVIEAFNFLFEKKVESKYLTLNAIEYLSNAAVFSKRAGLLYGNGTYTTPEQALTYGERYFAIKTINEQIETTIEGFVDEYKLDAKKAKINKVDRKKIESIELASNTFKDVYYKDDKIELDEFELIIKYEESSGLEEVRVPVYEDMFVTKFDSAAAGKKELVIGFDKIELDEDGEEVYTQLTAKKEYEIKEARATKAEKEEEKDEIENRYTPLAEIKDEDKVERISLNYEGNDKYLKDAYRKLANNLESQNRDIEYFYTTGFETVLMGALQYELGEKALKDNPISVEDAKSEYDELVAKNKLTFENLDTDKKKLDKVNELISSNLNALYYFPSVAELPEMKDFFYVDQILINFSEEQKAFLKDFIGKDEDLNNILYEMIKKDVKTNESNPKYDVEFDCPKHEGGDKDAACKFVEEDAENNENLCPSKAFIANDIAFDTIFNELETAIKNANSAEKRLEVFDEFKYKYNDDPGIMNNNTGYLIPPKSVKSSFYQSFVDLGLKLYNDAKDKNEEFVGKALIDGKLQYAFTDYGIHIIMISMTPFHDIDKDAHSFGFEDSLDLIGTTFKENLDKQLKTQVKNKAYTDYVLALIEKKVIDNKDIVKVEQKKIDKLLKPYKDLV